MVNGLGRQVSDRTMEKHGEWTGKTGIRQNYGNLPGSRRSMNSYALTYFRL